MDFKGSYQVQALRQRLQELSNTYVYSYRSITTEHLYTAFASFLPLIVVIILIKILKEGIRNGQKDTGADDDDLTKLQAKAMDLAKVVSYDARKLRKLQKLLSAQTIDINKIGPPHGLSIFLCACLSADKKGIKWLLERGGDVRVMSTDGDGPMYLATFGLLNSLAPDLSVLHILAQAGCDVNHQNAGGFTPLHRAASRGNLPVINYLKHLGADVYLTNNSGTYPLDSAINAGHIEVAESLQISLDKQYLWDVVEPHTPLSVRLGLQSPRKKHLVESSRPSREICKRNL